MRKLPVLVLTLAGTLPGPLPASAAETPGTWTAYGPSTGGFIQTVAAHPSGEGPVFISMGPTSPSWPIGVRRSLDGGETFVEAAEGLPDRFYPQNIAFDPADPNVAYAAADVLYRTLDGGGSWAQVGDGLPPGYINSLLVEPGSGDVYASSAGGVMRSTDRGGTWSPRNAGLPQMIGTRALAHSASDPATMYVAVLLDGSTPPWTIYRSGNLGATWQQTGLSQNEFIYSQAVAPSDPATVYIGYQGGVKVTRNGGGTWTATGGGLPNSPVRSLLVLPGSPAHVLAGTSDGLFVTRDGGASWSEVGGGFRAQAATYSLSMTGGETPTIYATTLNGGGLYRSTDDGATWTGSAAGLPANVWVRGVATAPSQPGVAYAGAYSGAPSGAYRSSDGGRSWKSRGGGALPTGSISSVAVSPADPDVAFAGAYSLGVFKTVDGGTTWSKLSVPAGGIETVAVAPSNAQVVYASGANGDLNAGLPPAFFRSADGGQTWTTAAMFPRYPCSVVDVAVDPLNANVVYVAATFCGVFKSLDGGQTWLSMGAGMAQYTVLDVAVDPAAPANVYAAVYTPGDTGGVFKSVLGGVGWIPVLVGDSATSVVVDPANSQRVYAALSDDAKRVVRSTDGGLSWTAMNAGLATGDAAIKLAIDADGKRLYASTSTRGVYVMTPT